MKNTSLAALCCATLIGTAHASDTTVAGSRLPAPTQTMESPQIITTVRPIDFASPIVQLPSGLPTDQPAAFTVDQDTAVDAALLLPAVQAAREAARRTQ